ncbi:MAG: tRNA 2-thiouridine(34) synthase MnmA [Lentihominibacter sp.]
METKLDRNKVILGLSGGVDSTAAALLLQKQGYQVTGLYFNVLSSFCKNSEENIRIGREKAERAAGQLGINLIYADVSQDFDEVVVLPFCREYMSGRTPNPCIMCNPGVKFKTLIDAADEAGAYHIATGHYAGTFYDAKADSWFIKKSANPAKDQSYMLYRLNREQISRLILPLEQFADKEDVRAVARSAGTDNADRVDSQEICFVDSSDTYLDFLDRRGFSSPEGEFVDSEGNVLGRHKGISRYTIGQRKGLGIALGKPAFVTKIDEEENRVVLGNNDELFRRTIVSTENILCKQSRRVKAKIRYGAAPADAELNINEDGTVTTVFAEPQRAATPGQSIVFYENDLVIGGGIISEVK